MGLVPTVISCLQIYLFFQLQMWSPSSKWCGSTSTRPSLTRCGGTRVACCQFTRFVQAQEISSKLFKIYREKTEFKSASQKQSFAVDWSGWRHDGALHRLLDPQHRWDSLLWRQVPHEIQETKAQMLSRYNEEEMHCNLMRNNMCWSFTNKTTSCCLQFLLFFALTPQKSTQTLQ